MAQGSSHSSQMPGHRNPDSTMFVGRQREFERLNLATEQALSGRGRVILLVGEPGIGKTRTARELAVRAEARGARVLWGWCYEGEGAPPYWPWVQPLRYYIQNKDPQALWSEMGPGAADIAEIIPDIRGKLPGLETPPTLDPEQARFRLFDSVTSFLKNAARSQPTVLVLDDLHWADRPSLLLLQFMARHLDSSQLLVVGAYRDSELSRLHPLSDTLAQLARQPMLLRETLQGFSLEDTGDFIEGATGVRPSPNLVEAVHTRTEGNPFFTNELIRLLSDRGTLSGGAAGAGSLEGSDDGLDVGIPSGVLEVIGQRLNRLSMDCYQTLTTASIIGREFDFNLLRGLHEETTEEQLLEVIDEALAARLIEDLPMRIDGYQFTHALTQQTLAQELSPSRRARLHLRIGEALEKLYGPNPGDHAAELAYHFSGARGALGPEKAVRYSLLAGERALASHAHEQAINHFQRALADKQGIPMDAEGAALRFGLGQALAATLPRHRIQEARDHLIRAFDYYAESGDLERAVAVVEFPFLTLPGHRTVAALLVSRALDQVPPDSAAAGRLLTRYITVLGIEEGDYHGAREAFQRALDIAEQEGDLKLEIRCLVNASYVDRYHQYHSESLEKNLRAIELVSHTDDPLSEVAARYRASGALMSLGDIEGARRHAHAMLAPAERLRDSFWLTTAFIANERISRLEGNWQAARQYSDQGLAVSLMDHRLLAWRALLEHQVGNYSQGAEFLARLLESVRLTESGPSTGYAVAALVMPLAARIAGVPSNIQEVREIAEAVLSSPSGTPLVTEWANAGLALLAVEQGDSAEARERYLALENKGGTVLAGGEASIDRILGLLAQAAGNLDGAVDHFQDALSYCRRSGYRPELAWTCWDLAGALQQRQRPQDRELALSLLEEAAQLSRELGMAPLQSYTLARQQKSERAPTQTPAYPDGLTQREVEVIQLVATGKTDREIAGALLISVGTVSTHVRNILNKTGCANRTEAATYAALRGLV